MNRQPLVTRDGWCVSTIFPATYENNPYAYRLSVFKPRYSNPYKVQYGDGDGLLFATHEDADRYCLEHGYLQVFYPGTWCPKHRRMHIFLGHRHGTMCHQDNRPEEPLEAQHVPIWKVRQRQEKFRAV